jgi:hypothetical protein
MLISLDDDGDDDEEHIRKVLTKVPMEYVSLLFVQFELIEHVISQ